jgi:hypothetical protein
MHILPRVTIVMTLRHVQPAALFLYTELRATASRGEVAGNIHGNRRFLSGGSRRIVRNLAKRESANRFRINRYNKVQPVTRFCIENIDRRVMFSIHNVRL